MNLIKPTRLILILLIQSIASGVEKSIPSDLQRIIDIRQREIIKINKKYISLLEAKKGRYIALGDFENATKTNDLIKALGDFKKANDVINVASVDVSKWLGRWKFGTYTMAILPKGEFVEYYDGKVNCKGKWKEKKDGSLELEFENGHSAIAQMHEDEATADASVTHPRMGGKRDPRPMERISFK